MPGSWREEKGTKLPGLPRKFARFVLFRLIKKRSFNLLCVLDLGSATKKKGNHYVKKQPPNIYVLCFCSPLTRKLDSIAVLLRWWRPDRKMTSPSEDQRPLWRHCTVGCRGRDLFEYSEQPGQILSSALVDFRTGDPLPIIIIIMIIADCHYSLHSIIGQSTVI